MPMVRVPPCFGAGPAAVAAAAAGAVGDAEAELVVVDAPAAVVAVPPLAVFGAVVAAVVDSLLELFDEQAASRPRLPTPTIRSIDRRLM